jgi:hypothetical protein
MMLNKLTHFETSEKTIPSTHFYKSRYGQVKDAIIAVASEIGFQTKSQNDDHKEFLLKRGKTDIIVTVCAITAVESAIDLTINTPLLKSGKKLAVEFYNRINTKLKT